MKSIILSLLLLGGASFAFGQEEDEDPQPGFTSFGVVAGGNWDTSTFKFVDGWGSGTDEFTEGLLVVGGFLDFNVLEIMVAYSSQYGKGKLTTATTGDWTGGGQSFDLDTQFTAVNVRAVGKWPIRMDGIVVYPLYGLEYDYNLKFKNKSSAPKSVQDQMNDFMLVLGGGLDVKLFGPLFLREELRIDFNLTPNRFDEDKGVPAGITYNEFGVRLGGSVSLGIAVE